jgi:hypothetical protein
MYPNESYHESALTIHVRLLLLQKAIQSVQRARIRMQNKATETFELTLPIPGREMRKLIQGD